MTRAVMGIDPFNPAPSSPRTEAYINSWRRTYEGSNLSILFLGAGVMQLPGLSAARDMGITLHVCDGNSSAEGIPLAHQFYHIDLRDTSALTKKAAEIQRTSGLNGVVTMGTDFSLPVAHIARELDLPGISPEAARAASRKSAMRERFGQYGLPSPRAYSINRESWKHGFIELPDDHGMDFPVVAKPDDNMGARGVVCAYEPDDFRSAVEHAMGFSASGTVVVEELIEGPEFSLDSFIDGGKFYPMGLARRNIAYPPYFIETGHHFPSGVTASEAQSLYETLAAAARALGINHGAAKGDIFLGKTGPVIGEIAARLSGGYMSGWTTVLHSGISPSIGAIQLCLGQSLIQDFDPEYFPSIARLPSQDNNADRVVHVGETQLGTGIIVPNRVHERGLISIPGTLREIHHPKLTEGTWFFPTVQPGDRLRFPRNNVEKCGNYICSSAIDKTPGSSQWISSTIPILESLGMGDFLEIISQDFPLAYPGLLTNPSLFSLNEALPQWILSSTERDWNDRTPGKTLELLAEHAGFAPGEQQLSRFGGSYLSLLYACVFIGGVQAGLYFLELDLKESENTDNDLCIQLEELVHEKIQAAV